MKVVWALSAIILLSSIVSVFGEAKKYDPKLHDLKKTENSEGKAVSDLSNLQALQAQNKQLLDINQLITAIFGGNNPLAGLLGNPLTGIGAILAGIFAVGAAIAAGFAALVGFIVPPLQIVNQILAIIALALLTAYVVEDKKSGDYYDYDTGYISTGYDMGGYGDTSGYSAPYSGGGGSGSSYTSYRRSDDSSGRSNAYRPLLNRVAKMVGSAVDKYSKLYD